LGGGEKTRDQFSEPCKILIIISTYILFSVDRPLVHSFEWNSGAERGVSQTPLSDPFRSVMEPASESPQLRGGPTCGAGELQCSDPSRGTTVSDCTSSCDPSPPNPQTTCPYRSRPCWAFATSEGKRKISIPCPKSGASTRATSLS